MPQSRFFQTPVPASAINPPSTRPRPHVEVSKEVRAALRASRQDAAQKYQGAVQDVYATIEQQVKDVAKTHAKSIRRVQSDLHMGPQISMQSRSRKNAWNAFCWKKFQDKENNENENTVRKKGKEVLQDFVQNAELKVEYAGLTQEEKEALIAELEQVKATKAKGFRSSARSRVNDITKTMAVLENEINNLRSRSGIEAILFITRGSTDTPLNGTCFTTPGVEDFLPSVLKLDKLEFLARMDGYAIQGLKGTADSYKIRVAKRRSEIRDVILTELRRVSGDKTAQMEWKNYWVRVVARYQVIIEGWPSNIPFRNLSAASSPLADLESLLQMWQDGTTYWKQLTASEAEKLINGMKERGEIQEPQRRTRSDRGRKRKRQDMITDEESGGNDTRPFNNWSRKRQKGAIGPDGAESSGDEGPGSSDEDWGNSDED